MTNRYVQTNAVTHAEMEDAIMRDDVVRLRDHLISLAMLDCDFPYIEKTCLDLSRHKDEQVRGNAILGFSHVARRARALTPAAKTIIESGLNDHSSYVRDHAWSSADDVIHFLKWDIKSDNP